MTLTENATMAMGKGCLMVCEGGTRVKPWSGKNHACYPVCVSRERDVQRLRDFEHHRLDDLDYRDRGPHRRAFHPLVWRARAPPPLQVVVYSSHRARREPVMAAPVRWRWIQYPRHFGHLRHRLRTYYLSPSQHTTFPRVGNQSAVLAEAEGKLIHPNEACPFPRRVH